jgi:tape measure domain
MSTVDNRIVRMQFDNAQFEAGVMRSMNTLDKLNEKLQFKEAAKGLSSLMVAIDGVSSKSVATVVNSLDKISSYTTSVLGMMAQKVKTQFADKIVDAIEAIPARAMSQIKSGGWNRAMNIANAKFQIEGLKYSWDAVREAADYAVTDTAYGLDSAAKAASQLAASGVDFEKIIGKDGAGKDVTQMHKSLRAISGVAAMTNASYDDIAHTFTRIAGQGRVMGEDLNSLASRGLNAAATLAKSLNVTESEVRDMVSKGVIDFQMFSDAMDEAYGDHAKEANKTFTGSLSNMKAALSRIGAIFTQPVIDKTNTFFVAVTDRIKEFQKALNDTTAADGTKTLRFAGHFAEAWESGVNAASKFVKFINLDWFQTIGKNLDNLAIKAKTVFDGVSTWFDKAKASADKLEAIGEKAKMTVEDLAIVEAVIRGDYGNGLVRINEFAKKGLNYDRIQGFVDEAAKVNYNLKQLGWTVEDLNKETEEATKNGSLAQLQSERLSKTVGNFFNALHYGRNTIINIGTAVKTVLGEIWFSVSEAMAGPLILSRRISTLMHSIDMLTKDLQPTESLLNAIGNAAGTLWHDFDMLTESVLGTANSVIRFAAQCLRSEKTLEELADSDKLTPLQQSVISVMRVIKNLGIVVANVASSIYKIIRAVVKGLGKAFNPSGVLGGVAEFSEGLANLTEKFKITDEAASVIETVFEGLGKVIMTVAGAVSKVVGGIVKFISSIGKAKTPTDQVADTLEKVEETGEKTTSVFDNLKKVFENIGKKIKELSTKFQELKDAVDQQEGVIRLKESFDKLKTSIKESLEKIKPFEKDVKEVGEAAGGTGETAIGTLASGIGIVAGKLADFIDKLPGWGTKIEEFWNNVKTTVETWISNIHLDKFFDNLGDGVTEFFESDDSIIGKIRTFADKVFEGITGALEDVDWKKVGKGGILTLVAMNLFNFFRIGSGIETSIRGFASIPKNIGKIFSELGTVFTTANKSLKKITNAYIFSSIISSLMLMVSAVIILGGMDQNELKQGIAAVIWLAVGMAIIGKAVGAILGSGDRYFNKQNIKEIDKSTKNLVQVNNSLGGLIGAGILLAGLGAAVWLMSKALIDLGQEMKTNKENLKAAFYQIVLMLVAIGSAFAAIAVASMFVSKQTRDGKASLDNLFGAGVLLAGIGAAVFLITKAFIALAKDLEGVDSKSLSYAALTVVVIMTLLTGFVAAAGLASKNTDWKSLGMLTVMMVVAVGMIAVIATEVMLLAKAMGHAQVEGHGDAVMAAMGVIAAIMLSLGTMIFLMGKGLENLDHGGGALIGAVLTSAILVLAIAVALKLIVDSVKDVDTDKLRWAIGGIVAIVLILGVAVTAMFALASSIFYSDQIINILVSIGFVFVMVGAMLLLVAEAISMIDQVSAPAVIAVGALLLAIFAAVGLVINKIAKQPEAGGNVQKALLGVAVAFLAIAGAALMIAGAIKLLSGVTMDNAMIASLLGIVLFLGLFSGIAIVVAAKHLDKAFMNVGIAIALMGAAFLLAGAGIWVAAKGLELIVSMAGDIATTIITVAEAIKEHWVIFLGLLGGLALLTWLVTSIIKNVGPIATVIVQAVGSIVNIVSDAFTAIGKVLKTGSKNFSKWWSDLQPKVKIGIVTGIMTLCAAILKASPEVLKTIKELIKKLIFFVIDIIPTVVDGLVQILIRLLNSLADTIRKNSAEIAYAFWNIMEALSEIILDVIAEGIMLMLKPISGLLKKAGINTEWLDNMLGGVPDLFNGVKASLRSGLKDAKDYSESTEQIVESMVGLDASMNKVEKDLKKESIHYDNSAAGLAKYRGELEAARVSQDKTAMSRGSLIDGLKDKFGDSLNFDNFSTDQLQGMFDQSSLTIPGSSINLDPEGMPGMETFMEGQGYNESDISFEAMDGGETYTDAWAAGMTTPEAQGEIQSAVVDNVGVVQDELEAHKDELGKSVDKGIIGPVRNKMNLANSDFKNEGEKWFKSTAEGFNEGYNKYSKDPLKYMAQFGNEVNNSFRSKKGIDSNSPSKKFYQSGLWCILGFQQAIKDNSYLATGQMENLGSSMVDAIGQPLDYVSKIASGDIEYDPRIRPVMDLSNIGRTATDVSSMFANQNVTLSGMTGQIAYDMTTLNGSNAAVVSELQALREDMNYMTEEMANMQIVMDTGALVGSTVGAYDDALGRRAIYGERGN